MAGELQAPLDPSETGLTIYAQAMNEATGQFWNGSAFENYATANIANYAITPITEQGSASGVYKGDKPAWGAVLVTVIYRHKATGSYLESDRRVHLQSIDDRAGSNLSNVSANVVQIGGVTQSATDLKDFVDTGYDPATHKVQGVVLVDTLTTYTGNTPQTGDVYALANGASGFVAIKTETASIQSDTNDIQTRLPAALTADGLMKADTLRVGGTLQTAGDLAALIVTATGYIDTEVATVVAGVADIQSRLPAALTGAGYMKCDALAWAGAATATDDVALATAPANFASLAISVAGGVTLADGVAHGGTLGTSTATLALKRVWVSNNDTQAAFRINNTGTGKGILVDTSEGTTLELNGFRTCLNIQSSDTTGVALVIMQNQSAGFEISVGSSAANLAFYNFYSIGGSPSIPTIAIYGSAVDGNSPAVYISTDPTNENGSQGGVGLYIASYNAHAFYTDVVGGNGSGWYSEGSGTGDGMFLEAGASGLALRLTGGTTFGGAVLATDASNDIRGVKLHSAGLDSISTTAPSGVAANFREMVVQLWRRWFKKTTKNAASDGAIKTYADDGSTVVTTQSYTDGGTSQEVDAAT